MADKIPLDDIRLNAYYRIVAGKLLSDIKQTKPFQHLEEEALLNLMRTADALARRGEIFFEQHGISHAQYNVLRILRGAGPEGLTCGEIASRSAG